MDDVVKAERRTKQREYMREWLDRDGGAGRKKARERRREYIESLKDQGLYEEFLAKRREREKAYYYRDVDATRIKAIDRSRRFRMRNWDKTMFQRARERAKRKGIPFSIEQSDIVIPKLCPVLGIAIDYQLENLNDNSPSLDRIKPEFGYVKGNIRVISQRANRLKCDGTAAEMLLIHQDLLRIESNL